MIGDFFGKEFFKKIIMSKAGEAFKGAFHGDDKSGTLTTKNKQCVIKSASTKNYST